MDLWAIVAICICAWLALSLLVGFVVGRSFHHLRDDPGLSETFRDGTPDLWGDVSRECDWNFPPASPKESMYDRCVCGGLRRYCGQYFTPARGYDWKTEA